jgi:hypothetical protein
MLAVTVAEAAVVILHKQLREPSQQAAAAEQVEMALAH